MRGAIRILAIKGADHLHRSFPQALLYLPIVRSLRLRSSEPLLRDLIEQLGETLAVDSGGILEVGLEAGREAPAIDLGFGGHALHCTTRISSRAPQSSMAAMVK
jgi:hypothetical protein